jgi:acyl-CoA thioester hydrolase
MPRILVQPLDVTADVIDVNGHVNNLAYLRWMQDIAIRHSTARGWPVERYLAAGTGWVVRSHYIEYLRPAHRGDRLTLLTWVVDLRRRSSRRRYLFWRAADRQTIATAETLWVFVDAASGRPRPIPEDLRGAFALVPEEEDVLQSCGLRAGAPAAEASAEPPPGGGPA